MKGRVTMAKPKAEPKVEAKIAPEDAPFKESKLRKLGKTARFPVILLQNEWAIFAQLAYNRDMTILELLKDNLAKFGTPKDLKTFDLKKLDSIKPGFKASTETCHFFDFRLPHAEGDRLGLLAKKLDVTKGDVLRYIINGVVESEGQGIEIEGDAPERMPKKRFDVNLPGDIYENISTYAENQQTSVSKLLRKHFPTFTDKEFERYKISVPRGRGRDMTKFSNPNNDPKGPWVADSLASNNAKNGQDDKDGLRYPIVHPTTGVLFACPAKGWKFPETEFDKLNREMRVIWPLRANGRILIKTYLKELKGELCHRSITIYVDMYEQVKERALNLNVLESDVVRAFLNFICSTVCKKKKKVGKDVSK